MGENIGSERRGSDISDEDADLAKAIAMSMNGNHPVGSLNSTTSFTTIEKEETNKRAQKGEEQLSIVDEDINENGTINKIQEEDEEDENTNRYIVNLPTEPPSSTPSEEISNISFRLADGSREKRTFYNTDKVEVLYAFVESIVPDAKRKVSAKKSSIGTHDYDLSFGFPLQSPSNKMDITISEAKLNKALVTMRFVN